MLLTADCESVAEAVIVTVSDDDGLLGECEDVTEGGVVSVVGAGHAPPDNVPPVDIEPSRQ